MQRDFIIVSVMMMTESGKVHRNQGRLRVDLLILTKTKLQSLVYPMQTASLEQKKILKINFRKDFTRLGKCRRGLGGGDRLTARAGTLGAN